MPAAAQTLRLAVYAAPLSRDGPGLLLRDIGKDEAQAAAAARIVAEVAPDILVLTDIDYDHGLAALTAFADRAGGYPHRFALRPNGGMATGVDLDGDGRVDARDAQGYGRFAGDGGMAVLSRHPILAEEVRDFSALLWRDLPGATLPTRDGAPFPTPEAQAIQRLSSNGHWAVPVATPGGRLTLLVHDATPPVFDGPEDRNGLRARDELRLWQVLLDGGLGAPPPAPFVVMANTNLDPADGEGDRSAMAAFLADPRLQDPRPASPGGAAAPSPGHAGDPSLATADWDEANSAGNLRVAYILPSADLAVTGAGVFWPAAGTPGADLLAEAGPHRLVWVDIAP
nr:endonuclease/exonuclease/phosphatase family protein [Oceanicola granulosus]